MNFNSTIRGSADGSANPGASSTSSSVSGRRSRRKYTKQSFVRLQDNGDDGYEDDGGTEEIVFGAGVDATQLPSGGTISARDDPLLRARRMFENDSEDDNNDDDDLLIMRQNDDYRYHNYRSQGFVKVLYGLAVVAVISLACVTGYATTKHFINKGRASSSSSANPSTKAGTIIPTSGNDVYDPVNESDGGVLPDTNDVDTEWKQTPPSTFDMGPDSDVSSAIMESLKQVILVNELSSELQLQVNANTPQRKALRWMALKDPAKPNVAAGDGALPTILKRYALTTLFFATNGPQWKYNNKWLLDANICEWYGVYCEQKPNTNGVGMQTVVSGITLARNNLVGSLPNEFFRRMTDLNLLSLHTNELTGTLSPEVQHLRQLETLALFNNTLGGNLPSTMGQMKSLANILLSGNRFLGSIPAQFGQLQQLEQLHLYDNSLFGIIPSLTQCTQLKRLWLSQNRLSGRLARNFFATLPNLEAFYVDDNFLSGPLGGDTQLAKATNMKDMRVYKNLFSSSIPSDLQQLTRLELLYMDQNQLDGTIPSFQGLTKLRELSLFSNKLTGPIPATLPSELQALQVLDVGNNRLQGALPNSFGTLPNLMKLRVYRNQLIGKVPDALRQCTRLDDLQLQHNAFNGELPLWMLDNDHMRVLFLSDNQFRGTIPDASPTSMLHLKLDQNNFVGSVPHNFCLQSMRQFVVDCGVSCSCCTSCVSNNSEILVQGKNWNQ